MVLGNRLNAPESRADETRIRIFENTLDLIEKEGVERLTVRRIAEASSVSPALIIQYFGSKDRLLQLIFERRNALILSTLETKLKESQGDTFLQQFELVAQTLLQRDMSTPQLTLQAMAHSFRWSDEEEAMFRDKMKPFFLIVSEFLSFVDKSIPNETYRLGAVTFFMVYTSSVRLILKQNMTEAEALDYLRPHLKLISDGIAAHNR